MMGKKMPRKEMMGKSVAKPGMKGIGELTRSEVSKIKGKMLKSKTK